ncbi:MAG: hypothetical protein UR65_C0030G0010 [Candidatus Moranbacteria bacterium GW2011_GWE2_35_164]|nr:MAG: hypothetical protein UR65_C0030G0010 [Candidatus Moranbacteria bacterium GW2011_GWE2_35_164]
MKRSILLAVSWGFVFIFATLLGGCYNGVAHIRAGIEDHVNRNSTIDTCLILVAIAPRILHGKYYYDRCLFQGPGKETSWATWFTLIFGENMGAPSTPMKDFSLMLTGKLSPVKNERCITHKKEFVGFSIELLFNFFLKILTKGLKFNKIS